MFYAEFSQKIKIKYPQYKDIDDLELAQKMVSKHPVYREHIEFEEPDYLGNQITKIPEETPPLDWSPPVPKEPEIRIPMPKSLIGKEESPDVFDFQIKRIVDQILKGRDRDPTLKEVGKKTVEAAYLPAKTSMRGLKMMTDAIPELESKSYIANLTVNALGQVIPELATEYSSAMLRPDVALAGQAIKYGKPYLTKWIPILGKEIDFFSRSKTLDKLLRQASAIVQEEGKRRGWSPNRINDAEMRMVQATLKQLETVGGASKASLGTMRKGTKFLKSVGDIYRKAPITKKAPGKPSPGPSPRPESLINKLVQEATNPPTIIPLESLAETPTENITQMIARFEKIGKEQGLNPAQARQFAIDKLREFEPTPIPETTLAQEEFGVPGGVEAFGKGAKGEQDLFDHPVIKKYGIETEKVPELTELERKVIRKEKRIAKEAEEFQKYKEATEKELGGEEKGRMIDYIKQNFGRISPGYFKGKEEYKVLHPKVKMQIFSKDSRVALDEVAESYNEQYGTRLNDSDVLMKLREEATPMAGGIMHKGNALQNKLEKKDWELGDVRNIIRLRQDISVNDIITGQKVTLKKGHEFKPIELEENGRTVNKFLMQDGKQIIVDKSTYERIKRENVELGQLPMAMPEGVKEVVKGGDAEAKWEIAASKVNKAIRDRLPEKEIDKLRDIRDELRKQGKGKRETKFSKWTLPGGEEYSEILLQAPSKYIEADKIARAEYSKFINKLKPKYGEHFNPHDIYDRMTPEEQIEFNRVDNLGYEASQLDRQDFKGGHFPESNTLAWIRKTKRTTPDGKEVYFLEEIQSDWAKAGREKGFREEFTGKIPEGYKIEQVSTNPNLYEITNPQGRRYGIRMRGKNEVEAYKNFLQEGRTPFSPHLKNWQELTLKRVLMEAVEGGYDYISWTTGQQQADRYDLSKQIDEVKLIPSSSIAEKTNKEWNLMAYKGDKTLVSKFVNSNEVSDYIGKGVAEKLLEAKKDEYGTKTVSGLDLKIGGEWATSLYDRMIPNILKDLTKKWGGKIEDITIIGKKLDTGGYGAHHQQALRITPQIREMVQYGGQPMAGGIQHGMPSREGIARDLVESRTREEVQDKLQGIFGSYENLEKMADGDMPYTKIGEMADYYMADIEYAAIQKDIEEVKELLYNADKGVIPDAYKWKKPTTGFYLPLRTKRSIRNIQPKESEEIPPKISEEKEPFKISPEQQELNLGFPPKPPGTEHDISVMDLPVNQKVNLLDYVRTPFFVLEKIGLGEEAFKLKKSYAKYQKDIKGEIQRIRDWKSRVPDKSSAQNIFRYLDGWGNKLTATEKKVADEIQQYLGVWADRLKLPSDKRISKYITHIFEDDFIQKEFDAELAKIIADKIPGSVYDPFLLKRLGKKGYIEDVWRALQAYTKRAVRKWNLDPVLESLKKAAQNHPLENERYVMKLTNRINLRPTELDNLIDNLLKIIPGIEYKLGQRPTNRITHFVRRSIYRGALGLNIGSATRNITQGINTYAVLGEKYLIRGYYDLITKGLKEVTEVGAMDDTMVRDENLGVYKKTLERVDKGLFYLFQLAEKINRGSAYYGGKAKALKQGKSLEEAQQAGIDVVAQTQFRFGSVDSPVALASDIMRMLTVLKTFDIKQAEFLANMFKDKEYLGLLRWIAATIVVYATLGKALGWRWRYIIPSVRLGVPGTEVILKLIKYIAANENKKKRALGDIVRTGAILFPGGVQARKTIRALKSFDRGFVRTSGEEEKVRFPVAGTARNLIMGGLFGENAFEETMEFYNKNRKHLGLGQSKTFKMSQDANAYYERLMKRRERKRELNKKRDRLRRRK